MKTNYVLTVDEIKECEVNTQQRLNISTHQLMQQAGLAIVDSALKNSWITLKDRILIVCGTGHNGGDGLVVAELLHRKKFAVKALIVGDAEQGSLAFKEQFNLYKAIGGWYTIIDDLQNNPLEPLLEKTDCIIDALFGYGLNRPLSPFYVDLIDSLNNAHKPILSIDIPSGIDAISGNRQNAAIQASTTFILGHYKPGNLLQWALDHHGQSMLVDIGLVEKILPIKRFILCEDHLSFLKKRKHQSHKYDYGHVLIIGGSCGMMGSLFLAANAAYRSGAGLVSVALLDSLVPYKGFSNHEIMTPIYHNEKDFQSLLIKKSCVVYGMGLGKNKPPFDIIKLLLTHSGPVVIDAEGIEYIKPYLNLDMDLSHVVITPHWMEMARLLSIDIQQLSQNPLHYVEEFAQKTKITVVLKGPCTLIVNEQYSYFSPYATPGLATAGSGDVLAGVMGALVNQHRNLIEAAKLAVFYHSQAGLMATENLNEHSVMASDIIDCLPWIIKTYSKD